MSSKGQKQVIAAANNNYQAPASDFTYSGGDASADNAALVRKQTMDYYAKETREQLRKAYYRPPAPQRSTYMPAKCIPISFTPTEEESSDENYHFVEKETEKAFEKRCTTKGYNSASITPVRSSTVKGRLDFFTEDFGDDCGVQAGDSLEFQDDKCCDTPTRSVASPDRDEVVDSATTTTDSSSDVVVFEGDGSIHQNGLLKSNDHNHAHDNQHLLLEIGLKHLLRVDESLHQLSIELVAFLKKNSSGGTIEETLLSSVSISHVFNLLYTAHYSAACSNAEFRIGGRVVDPTSSMITLSDIQKDQYKLHLQKLRRESAGVVNDIKTMLKVTIEEVCLLRSLEDVTGCCDKAPLLTCHQKYTKSYNMLREELKHISTEQLLDIEDACAVSNNVKTTLHVTSTKTTYAKAFVRNRNNLALKKVVSLFSILMWFHFIY